LALPKENRIKNKKDIDGIFKKGRTVKSSSLFIRFLDNKKDYSRVALIVPAKNVYLAVDRNKIKRMLYGELAKNRSLLKRGLDVIVVVNKKATRKDFKKLVGEFKEIMPEI